MCFFDQSKKGRFFVERFVLLKKEKIQYKKIITYVIKEVENYILIVLFMFFLNV